MSHHAGLGATKGIQCCLMSDSMTLMPNQVAGANRRWRFQFRCRGSHHESAVAQLSTSRRLRAHHIMSITEFKEIDRALNTIIRYVLAGGAFVLAVGIIRPAHFSFLCTDSDH